MGAPRSQVSRRLWAAQEGGEAASCYDTRGLTTEKKATAEYEVVPGSGTNELAGLSGTGGFSVGHAEEYDITLDYEV